MSIFSEAYGNETKRRSRFGMDRTDEGRGATGMSDDDYDPSNNPFAKGLDPDDVQWPDEDTPSPDEEREIARGRKSGLDAALADARADEGEDEDEAEDEQESEDEDEAIGFGKAGVRDSRR